MRKRKDETQQKVCRFSSVITSKPANGMRL
jgi:hypothetical protein